MKPLIATLGETPISELHIQACDDQRYNRDNIAFQMKIWSFPSEKMRKEWVTQ